MFPPLWFDEVKTGYLYTGAFIGSVLGLVLSGVLSDSINKVMIKLNKGKYEPEFRILLVVFQLIFSGIGLYGFGITSTDTQKYGWLIPDVFFMFVIMGMVMGAVASALYIVDAHRTFPTGCLDCVDKRKKGSIAHTWTRKNRGGSVYVLAHLQEHVQLCPDVLRL